MASQVTVTPEDFVTLSACVGFDVSVGKKVCFKVGALVEGPSTGRAFMRGFL